MLNSISEAVVASDINGQIKFMNPVAESLSGWPQERALHQNLTSVLNFVNGSTGCPITNPLLQALQNGEVASLPEDTLLR
ncbi:PAS domain-containing protein, partial [Haemophilus parainfluenzae]